MDILPPTSPSLRKACPQLVRSSNAAFNSYPAHPCVFILLKNICWAEESVHFTDHSDISSISFKSLVWFETILPKWTRSVRLLTYNSSAAVSLDHKKKKMQNFTLSRGSSDDKQHHHLPNSDGQSTDFQKSVNYAEDRKEHLCLKPMWVAQADLPSWLGKKRVWGCQTDHVPCGF